MIVRGLLPSSRVNEMAKPGLVIIGIFLVTLGLCVGPLGLKMGNLPSAQRDNVEHIRK